MFGQLMDALTGLSHRNTGGSRDTHRTHGDTRAYSSHFNAPNDRCEFLLRVK